jgi:hypothetical protein
MVSSLCVSSFPFPQLVLVDSGVEEAGRDYLQKADCLYDCATRGLKNEVTPTLL